MKVLLAIDSSPASEYVVNTAATRPWPSGTAFCVMSVVDLGRWEGRPAVVEDAKREAQSLVKSATEKLAQSGHEVCSEIQLGSPKKAIPEHAKRWGADLVMIGSHGKTALTRFLLGSVAQAVLRTSPCSVEIVRHSPASAPPSQAMKILLASDGSRCSAKAALSVANRPWPAGSQISIVSVVQLLTPEIPNTAAPLASEYPTSLLEHVWEEARTHAEEAVAEARKTLSATGLKVCERRATPVGEPRALILDDAEEWEADLIVLGSHGRHGWDRMLLGSVSESVALYAHCSVEVVR
ncbi:MAG: universal stress protein [Terriglobales bacterium]